MLAFAMAGSLEVDAACVSILLCSPSRGKSSSRFAAAGARLAAPVC